MDEKRVRDAICCEADMSLNSLEEIRDRGGDLDVGDALCWECYDCNRLIVIVTV